MPSLHAVARRALSGDLTDTPVLLTALVNGDLAVPTTGERLDAASTAVLAALAILAAPPIPLDEGLAEALVLCAATEPSPLLATLYADVVVHLGGAVEVTRSPALRARTDGLTGPRPSAAGVRLDASTADALLGALAFATSDAAAALLLTSVSALAAISTRRDTLSRDAGAALRAALTRAVNGTTATLLSFATWPAETQRAVSDVVHARAVAAFDASRCGGRTWTPRQAAELEDAVQIARDAPALGNLEAAVREASAPFGDGAALPGTAWAAVRRAIQPLRDAAESSVDRRSDLTSLTGRVHADAAWIFEQIPSLWTALAQGTTPALSDAPAMPVDPTTAAWLRGLATHRLASARSLPNLLLTLLAGPHEAVRAQVDAYIQQWPDADVFDFNKLDRQVKAGLSGDTRPIYTLNGEAVEAARLHVAVGLAVKAALAKVAFPLPWIAHRFGYRAKQAAELVDLLAERAAQGRGALAQLRLLRPDAALHVLATTSDLEYNSLIFQVETGSGRETSGRETSGRETWYADSAGQVALHSRAPEPKHVLFDAVVDARGAIAFSVPASLGLSSRAYPLVCTWGLGDRVDVEARVAGATDHLVETERFATASQVQCGTITAYDTQGNHTLEVDTPAGKQTRVATWDQVRGWNNPHLVAEEGGVACSVVFNRSRDPRFVASLAEADRIAAAHGLPEFDLALTEVELAAAQKRFLRALNAWSRTVLIYPRHPPKDEADKAYDDKLDDGVHPMGAYLELKRGVCRHQFVHEHMGKQRAGVDERFASGAANTGTGAFRGLHIWGEVILPDRSRLAAEHVEPSDTRYLSDATWGDPYVPLWEGAYGNDLRRVEMYARTAQYATLMVRSDLR